MKITKKTSLERLAFIVSDELIKAGLHATLSGGGAVTIYTDNQYISRDLDFVSGASNETLEAVLSKLGFTRDGRHFTHPDTEFTVEFPPSPVMLGSQPSREVHFLEKAGKRLKILSPTESVMDRLAGFFAWNDRQNLRQAIMICHNHNVDLKKIEKWSREEGFAEKFGDFMTTLKQTKSTKK